MKSKSQPRSAWIDGADAFGENCSDRIEAVSLGGIPEGATLVGLGRTSTSRNM